MPIIKNVEINDNWEYTISIPESSNVIKAPVIDISKTVLAGVGTVKVISKDAQSTSSKSNKFNNNDTQDDVDLLDDDGASSDTFSSTNESGAELVFDQPANHSVDESAIRKEIQSELKTELQAHFDDFTSAIDSLQAARNGVIEQSQQHLVDFALVIAEKIIAKRIEMDPTVINDVVAAALEKVSGSDQVTFKVNPEDVETLNQFQSTIESKLAGLKKLVILPDPTIDRGGAVIDTNLGYIDVSIKEQLNLIARTLEKLPPPQ